MPSIILSHLHMDIKSHASILDFFYHSTAGTSAGVTKPDDDGFKKAGSGGFPIAVRLIERRDRTVPFSEPAGHKVLNKLGHCPSALLLDSGTQMSLTSPMKTCKTCLVLIVALAAMGLQPLRADQPRMTEALRHLREARAALEQAEHNKAGHREKAIQLVEQAIAEVEAGIAAGR
jgi:hypothetical protein